MSNFSPKWSKDWPTETGMYWFYGDPNGNSMTEKTDKRVLILVKVAKTANGVIRIGGGRFIYESECGVYVRWMPALLPAPPDEGETK